MNKERLEELHNFIHCTLNGVLHEGKNHISMALTMEEWDEFFALAKKGLEENAPTS